jgi:hypothetical protein
MASRSRSAHSPQRGLPATWVQLTAALLCDVHGQLPIPACMGHSIESLDSLKVPASTKSDHDHGDGAPLRCSGWLTMFPQPHRAHAPASCPLVLALACL